MSRRKSAPRKRVAKGKGKRKRAIPILGRYRPIVAYRTEMHRSTHRVRNLIPLAPGVAGRLHQVVRRSVAANLQKYGPHVYLTFSIETIGPIYEARVGETDPDEKFVTKFNTPVEQNVNDLLLSAQEVLDNIYDKTNGRFARLVQVDVTMFAGYKVRQSFAPRG